jgi:hypothetical protein
MPPLDTSDLRWTIVPKSDQLNAEQLLGGPITITVTGVEVHDSAEQPISIRYENDDGRPYKPAKTMRKVLIFAWGADGAGWRGKSMTLYNDPSVRFGGTAVGGIRISHMSDIAKQIDISLTATKGKKALHTIKVLQSKPDAKTARPASAAAFDLRAAIHNVRVQIEADDAASAATYVSGLPKAESDAVLNAISEDEYNALIAAWPQDEAA